VYVCRSHQEVYDRFKQIMGVKNVLGAENTECVIQEFLEGKEYVVDSVSRDGKHKVVAVWEYDKRPTNGAPFVYFGLRLKSADEKRVQDLIKVATDLVEHGCGSLVAVHSDEDVPVVERHGAGAGVEVPQSLLDGVFGIVITLSQATEYRRWWGIELQVIDFAICWIASSSDNALHQQLIRNFDQNKDVWTDTQAT